MSTADYVLGTVVLFAVIWVLGYLFIVACGKVSRPEPLFHFRKRSRFDDADRSA